jgi:hypothetical protein
MSRACAGGRTPCTALSVLTTLSKHTGRRWRRERQRLPSDRPVDGMDEDERWLLCVDGETVWLARSDAPPDPSTSASTATTSTDSSAGSRHDPDELTGVTTRFARRDQR